VSDTQDVLRRYLCVTCGEFKAGDEFPDGDCSCWDCADANRGSVNWELTDEGVLRRRPESERAEYCADANQ
jgi:hypothetical protein